MFTLSRSLYKSTVKVWGSTLSRPPTLGATHHYFTFCLFPRRRSCHCCFHLVSCSRHGAQTSCNLCEGRPLHRVWSPALLHQPPPLRIAASRHRRPQCVVHNAPCTTCLESIIEFQKPETRPNKPGYDDAHLLLLHSAYSHMVPLRSGFPTSQYQTKTHPPVHNTPKQKQNLSMVFTKLTYKVTLPSFQQRTQLKQ